MSDNELEVKIVFDSGAEMTCGMTEFAWQVFKKDLAETPSVCRVEIRNANGYVWSVLYKEELEMTLV
jgi:hypothetical protein